MGAGLVIPFMNLYFKDRFHCSSAQIGVFFSIAQVFTAIAALARAGARAPLRQAARRPSPRKLLSLPFLVTLGAERRLAIAAGVVLDARHAHAGRHPAAADVHHGGAAAGAARARHEPDQPGVERRLGA